MAINDASCLGYDPSVAPKFNAFPYAQWCFRFKIFVQSKNIDLWEVIDYAYIVPTLEKSKWSKHDKKMFTMNKLVLEFLLNAFDSSMSNKLDSFDSAYTLWKFIEAHQGNLEEIRRALAVSSSSSIGASPSCTRPLGDSPSVVSDSESDDDISINELACAYDRLAHAYKKLQNDFIDLKSKHVELKSNHELLGSKFDIIAKENVTLKENNDILNLENKNLSSSIASLTHVNKDAMLEVECIRNEFDNHTCSTSIINDVVHNDELNLVKKRISCLDSTLNTCIGNHKKLMDMCAKSHATTPRHITHHAHMYSKIYKCSICGRKGHLSKFCYDAQKSKNSNINASCASHQVSSSHTHAHTHHVHHKHAHVFKCDICGRFGHLAKYCFDLKNKSHLPNASSRPHVYKCNVCGRFGHLGKFCFDLKRVSHLQNNFKRPSMFANVSNVSRAQPFGQHKQMLPFHCTYCNRKGHLSNFCYDRIRAPHAPKRVHNPRALSFIDRGHVPKQSGTKNAWVPK